MIKKRFAFIWLFACLYTAAFAQQESVEKSRILIVPFSRFDFQTAYPLKEIAATNGWSREEEVFGRYRDTVIRRLSRSNQNLSAFSIPAYEYDLIKNQLPRVYKAKPSTHFGVDIGLLAQNDRLKTLLTNFSADYILFICRYEISSRLVANIGLYDGSSLLPWSNHEITYELFDKEGNLVVMADQFKVLPKNPNAENIDTKGVLLHEVAPNYGVILDDIHQKLQVYQNQKRKKPVYRLKKR